MRSAHLSSEVLVSIIEMLTARVDTYRRRNSENCWTRSLITPLSSLSCQPRVRLCREAASPALLCNSPQPASSPAHPLSCSSLKKAKASATLFPGSSVMSARLQKIPNCRHSPNQVTNLASLSLSCTVDSVNREIDLVERIQEST